MHDWHEVAVGPQLKLTSGFPFASARFADEGIPLIRIRDILSSTTETYYQGPFPSGYLVKAGDILIGMDGDFNVVRWRGCDALLNQRILKVDIQNESVINLDFVYHWLGPFIKKINEVTAATTVKHLSIKDLLKAKAIFPKLERQQRIATILNTTDVAIEKNDALVSKYKQIKAGLMHDLFTRGVLPNGKLRPPQSDAPELYQETVVGWIPKDWQVKKLGQMAKIVSGVTLGSQKSLANSITAPYLRVANVQDGYLDLSEIKTVQISHRTLEYLRLQPGDVLMNEGGDFDKLGRGTVWGGEIEDCVHQNHVFRVRTDASILLPYYLAFYSESSFGKKYFLLSSKQSTNLASINSTQLNAYPIALPSLAEQMRLIERVDVVNQRINAMKIESAKLRSQKFGLMQDLLSGKASAQPASHADSHA